MQKFVVTKKSKSSITIKDAMPPPQVNISGYLKKKRNKMGGWRKLWFVLQNQLLLSYSSKEDYEKKLVPFKDVINLVPGTVVRPIKGSRFIIETSTNTIYTFRCDDTKICSAWVSTLMESLSLGLRNNKDNSKLHNQKKFNFSLDNLPPANMNNMMNSTRIYSVNKSWDSVYRSKLPKSPKLPIAQSTARLFQRSGMQVDDNMNHSNNNNCSNGRVRNFRLHQNNHLDNVSQCKDVSRINSMFISYRKSEEEHLLSTKIDENSQKTRINSSNNNKSNNIRTNFTENKSESMVENCEKNCSIEEQLQQMSLDDEQHNQSVSSRSENEAHLSQITMEKQPLLTPDINPMKPIESNNELNKFILSSTPKNGTEPIYAVVDLKHKYARRAKAKEIDKQEIFRPRSFHVSSSADDYEEVLHFSSIEADEDLDGNENIYEPINLPELLPRSPMWKYFSKLNIEALVEIAKRKKDGNNNSSSSSTSSPITTIIGNKDETTTFSDIKKRWGNHRKSIKNKMKRFYTKDNHTIGDKSLCCTDETFFGSNDVTAVSEEYSKINCNSSTCTNTYAIKDDKSKKDQKPIFGSLGRLKKPRASLCLEDVPTTGGSTSAVSIRKKLFTPARTDFQNELHKEINRRSSDKKTQCHSKFYD